MTPTRFKAKVIYEGRLYCLKMPGLRKSGDVTLTKAIFTDGNKLWDWFNQVKLNTIKRADVTVAMLDENGNPVHSWKLTGIRPKKYTVEGFKSGGNNIHMETIILAHEGVAPA